jgi:hypothetical protein
MFRPFEGYDAGFEAALDFCQKDVKGLDWTNQELLKACRAYWEAGKHYYGEFLAKYQVYFERVFDANPYAPNYVFYQACVEAGLPVLKWAEKFTLAEWGFLSEP